MTEKQLEITIKPNGEMNIETVNIKGAGSCSQVIENVLAGVGGASAATELKKTKDYWEDDRRKGVCMQFSAAENTASKNKEGILAPLNDAQKEVVLNYRGFSVVSAGPGSGKVRG